MEPRTLEFIADACEGELRCDGTTIVGRLCTDSRGILPGDLFIALKGDRFDAHSFLPEVAQKGVAAILGEKAKTPAALGNVGVILVDNTRRALGQFASRYRADFDLPIIAVGGSNGKTTTKELIAAVLRQKLPTLWSEASFNNDIGVPLTLLKLHKTHKAAVLEVGTNHPGELAPLLQMIRPRYSVITSIGREHLEFFHDLTGVVQEESALAELLPTNGKLFVNGENEWIKLIAKRSRAAVVKVGQASTLSRIWGSGWAKDPHFCARHVRLDETGITFGVVAPDEKFSGEYRVNLLGRHQLTNALLAIAVGAEIGLGREDIQRGLAEAQPAKMRMQVWSYNDVKVLDDAYNANADSMIAALETLAEFPCAGKRVAVLGDMAELGCHTADSHKEVGRKAAELGVDQLIAVGDMARATAEAAKGEGLKNVIEILDVNAAARAVQEILKPGDVVLLKASRATRLERVSEILRGTKKENGDQH